MQQYCFYTEQYKHISEEEQQQGDTVALNMDSVSFSACVLMTPCSCPKTWLSAPCPEWCFTDCLSLNLPLHPCSPLLAYSHLSPPATVWISWGCKQTGATLLPVSLMGRPRMQGRTTSFLKWWLWETRLGYSFWKWWWCFLTSHQSLITLPVPVMFSDGCTFTLHQQHTSGVDAATFAVTIWQILPKSKRNTCL